MSSSSWVSINSASANEWVATELFQEGDSTQRNTRTRFVAVREGGRSRNITLKTAYPARNLTCLVICKKTKVS